MTTTYTMQIRRNADGALSDHTITITDPRPAPYDRNTEIWLESWACNCDRALLFERGRGVELDNPPCGDGGYTFVYVDLNGVRIVAEDKPTPAADPDWREDVYASRRLHSRCTARFTPRN